MFGHWGAPRMGLEGSAWSTAVSRVYMTLVLAAAVLWHERKSGNLLFRVSWLPDLQRIRGLVALVGLPAAAQIHIEGAVFGLVTVWAARLDEASLAAHSIAVQVIATTFMVPLGISSAAAVRVGQAIGRNDSRGARTAGWTAMLFSTVFMGLAALVMSTAPRFIVRLFIADPAVIASGAILLRIAALFELFDGFPDWWPPGAFARIGRYAPAHGCAPARLLGGGSACRLRAVLSAALGRHRHLGGVDRRADPDRHGLGDGLVAKNRDIPET